MEEEKPKDSDTKKEGVTKTPWGSFFKTEQKKKNEVKLQLKCKSETVEGFPHFQPQEIYWGRTLMLGDFVQDCAGCYISVWKNSLFLTPAQGSLWSVFSTKPSSISTEYQPLLAEISSVVYRYESLCISLRY